MSTEAEADVVSIDVRYVSFFFFFFFFFFRFNSFISLVELLLWMVLLPCTPLLISLV